MKNSDVKETRTIAILSPGAAGKTSLADAMLFAAGMGIGLMFWGVAEPMTYFSSAGSQPLHRSHCITPWAQIRDD